MACYVRIRVLYVCSIFLVSLDHVLLRKRSCIYETPTDYKGLR